MRPLFIEDGFTLESKWPHGKNGFPAFSFVYRPALMETSLHYLKTIEHATAGAHVEAVAQMLAKHVQSWDIKKRDGTPVSISVDNLRRFQKPILEWMLNEVHGYADDSLVEDLKNSATPPS